jgi:hypothetical protein
MSRDVYHVRRVAIREEKMAWYALSDLVDGRGMSWRAIGDPAEANEEETQGRKSQGKRRRGQLTLRWG